MEQSIRMDSKCPSTRNRHQNRRTAWKGRRCRLTKGADRTWKRISTTLIQPASRFAPGALKRGGNRTAKGGHLRSIRFILDSASLTAATNYSCVLGHTVQGQRAVEGTIVNWSAEKPTRREVLEFYKNAQLPVPDREDFQPREYAMG
ncbi:hypothetical protein L209DRAFT_391063 [Thermothelomyces heterothallicus CBS 203.75]